ncbi:MAG: alpha-amylase family glycosyl hydrolase [Bacteroidota bacterium]
MNRSFLNLVFLILLLFISYACQNSNKKTEQVAEEVEEVKTPFLWENANIYFLLIDRFKNGDPSNDFSFERKQDGAVLRNFEGGDLRGIIQKIEEGYFNDLGITALWFTPPVEQITSHTDEGTGKTYAYHGYWTRDWTNIDPNYGTYEDLKELVAKAHEKGIRVLMDAVMNHTGPVTPEDSQWPDEWVRTSPPCDFKDAKGTIDCTLVANLPDIRTESDEEVELPPFLVEKWKAEGRYEQEKKELDDFFAKTGYPRAPRYYLIKWLCDYILELGIDGFRVDTVKHTEAEVWGELFEEAKKALAKWKAEHPTEKLDDQDFFMVGEVYFYSIQQGRKFPMGGEGELTDFFSNGFKSLINFGLKWDVDKNMDSVYQVYSNILHGGELDGKSVVSYMTSHDDGSPYDKERVKPFETATKLLLAPGASQVYYGDEIARKLVIEGANGDANLRSFMKWDDVEAKKELWNHWSKLGLFRKDHPALGAGVHTALNESPYMFKREYTDGEFNDKVVVVAEEVTEVDLINSFEEGAVVHDYYSGETVEVKEGKIAFSGPARLRLLAVKN